MYLHNNKNKSLGFTLIELMVVIAIISLLSTVVLTSLQKARSRARDQYRISSVKQLANAVELFYSTYGRYPTTGSTAWSYSCNGGGGSWISDTTYGTGWSTTYLSIQPHDPQESGCSGSLAPFTVPLGSPVGYGYYSDSTGSLYAIAARLENNTAYDVESTCQRWIASGNPILYSGTPCSGSMGWNQTTYFISSSYR